MPTTPTDRAATGSPQRAQEPEQHEHDGAVVHIAGADVHVNHLLRQRCAWCSTILIDYDLDRMAVPVGTDPRPAIWPVGALVAVDGGLSYVVDHPDDEPLPDGACAVQAPSVDRPSVAADSPTAPGEGDGQDTTPTDAQQAAEAAVAAREAAVCAVLDTMGWDDDRDAPSSWGVPPAPCWALASDIVNAVYPSIAADALRRYADRHHAHPGGPTNLIQTLTIREAGGAILDYDACRSCSARLDEHGQCAGERPRLLLAAQRIAAGEPDPADPPRPGTEWPGAAWHPEQADSAVHALRGRLRVHPDHPGYRATMTDTNPDATTAGVPAEPSVQAEEQRLQSERATAAAQGNDARVAEIDQQLDDLR